MRPKDNIIISSGPSETPGMRSTTDVASPSPRHSADRLFPPQLESSELTLRCRRSDYAASVLARAVEDCDAHLLNLNVTSLAGENADDLLVDLRISHRNALAVARSLERYGYDVVEIEGLDPDISDSLRSRIDFLIHDLDI